MSASCPQLIATVGTTFVRAADMFGDVMLFPTVYTLFDLLIAGAGLCRIEGYGIYFFLFVT